MSGTQDLRCPQGARYHDNGRELRCLCGNHSLPSYMASQDKSSASTDLRCPRGACYYDDGQGLKCLCGDHHYLTSELSLDDKKNALMKDISEEYDSKKKALQNRLARLDTLIDRMSNMEAQDAYRGIEEELSALKKWRHEAYRTRFADIEHSHTAATSSGVNSGRPTSSRTFGAESANRTGNSSTSNVAGGPNTQDRAKPGSKLLDADKFKQRDDEGYYSWLARLKKEICREESLDYEVFKRDDEARSRANRAGKDTYLDDKWQTVPVKDPKSEGRYD